MLSIAVITPFILATQIGLVPQENSLASPSGGSSDAAASLTKLGEDFNIHFIIAQLSLNDHREPSPLLSLSSPIRPSFQWRGTLVSDTVLQAGFTIETAL
jgi:hypothetical protein